MTIDPSARAGALGITSTFQRSSAAGSFLPQRIYVVGQGASASTYTNDKFQATNHPAVGARFGYGSPLHLAARQLFPDNGDGVGSIPVTFAPLQDAGGAVAAAGTITPTVAATESGTIYVKVNNILSEPITITTASTVATVCTDIKTKVDAVLEMPITTTDNTTNVATTAKWAGQSGNDIFVEIVGSVAGVSFVIVQPTGGATNPPASAVTTALGLMGSSNETLVLNCLDIADTGILDAINTHGEARWGPIDPKPYVAFTGVTETSVASAIAVSDARKTDRVNAQLVAPGSNDLPLTVAARQLARVAKVANTNPARGYRSQFATGLTPGPDEDQWEHADRDQALKGGSSSITVVDGVVKLADIVTFYHPTGEVDPPYRYVMDIVKLQNILYRLNSEFDQPTWEDAPMIEDDQSSTEEFAKTPAMAVTALHGVADFVADKAMITGVAATKAQSSAAFDNSNPKRLNITFPIKLSGNSSIIDIGLLWSFFYGGQAA